MSMYVISSDSDHIVILFFMWKQNFLVIVVSIAATSFAAFLLHAARCVNTVDSQASTPLPSAW